MPPRLPDRIAADAGLSGDERKPLYHVALLRSLGWTMTIWDVHGLLTQLGAEPAEYRQEQDEWVLLLEGGATLDVGGERVDLAPGDWVFLPAGVPHTLVRTDTGTSWLAVHLHP